MATKKELSSWLSVGVPVICAVFAAMIGFTVTGIRDRITDNENDIQRCVKTRNYQNDQAALNDRLNLMEGRIYELPRQ